MPLTYTNGNKLSGFNLVGNPFVHNVTSYDGYNVADGCYRINDAKTNLIVSNISNENPLKVGEGFFVIDIHKVAVFLQVLLIIIIGVDVCSQIILVCLLMHETL